MAVFVFRLFCFITLVTILIVDGWGIFANEREFTREVNNKTLRYIRRNWNRGTYNETSHWCASIGGRLPMLHTPEDLDYLASTVVGRTHNDPHLTWLGSSVSPGGSICQWTDGTPIETFHTFTTNCQLSNTAGACPTGSNCCALSMWTDSDFKELTVRQCTERLWQVCVIEQLSLEGKIIAMNESIARLSNDVQSIKSSMTEVQSNLRSVVDDLVSNQRNLLDTKHQESEQKFEDLESRLSNVLNESSKNLQDRMDRVNSTLEKSKSVLENKLSLTEKTMRERINQMSQLANSNRREQTTTLMNFMQNIRKQEESNMKSAEQKYKSLKEMNQTTRNLLYVMITCFVVAAVGVMIMKYKGVTLSELKAKSADERNIGPNFPSSKSSSSSLIPQYKSGPDQNLTTCV